MNIGRPSYMPITGTLAIVVLLLTSSRAEAMHITEGILPPLWAGLWFVIALPVVALGVKEITKRKGKDPSYMPLVAIFGAAVFVFSCFPIPVPIAGTTAHPAGTGLSAIFLGPLPSVVVAFVSLLLQALFLAHGGLTTLGGNTVSMGILGSFAGYFAFRLGRKSGLALFWSGFAAGVAADLFTYLGTSTEMALALHGDQSILSVMGQIYLAFMPTQIPLSIVEGMLTGGMLVYVAKHRPDIMKKFGILGVEK